MNSGAIDEHVCKTENVAPEQVRRVSDIYREFLADLRQVAHGRIRPLVDSDDDALGADFAFVFEVKPEEYENVVLSKSKLEATYFFRHGINFMVVPEAM